jgi:hypothetical protein
MRTPSARSMILRASSCSAERVDLAAQHLQLAGTDLGWRPSIAGIRSLFWNGLEQIREGPRVACLLVDARAG